LRLDDVRCLLERARATISNGWVQDRWLVLSPPSGARPQGPFPAGVGDTAHVSRACLIGAVAVAVHEGNTHADLAIDGGPAIDFVWDAVQAARGLSGPGVAGRAAPREVRLARMRDVARWNDRPGRTREDVLAVLDLAITHVIMAAMHRPATVRP
jgi:hypothetical protein